MVHNGIEYVEMQLLAELYALLRLEKSNEEIARIFEVWNEGGLSSYLLGITVKILRKKEGDHYLLDRVLDRAGNKGTGSWSSKVALDLGVPNGMMTGAVFARYISSFKERREYLASTLAEKEAKRATLDVEIMKNAYEFARLVNHQQGFQLMAQASSEFNWDLDFQSIARIWSNGCIIKSGLMNDLKEYFAKNDDLFMIQGIREELVRGEVSVVELLREGLNRRVSLPCFSSAYQFWVDSTTRNLSANLIQAQRDFFGAHTYQRIDDPEGQYHHSNWN
jgi:6-phosphogluconate dehydrogenase